MDKVFWFVALIVIAISFTIPKYLQDNLMNRITSAIQSGDFVKYEELISRKTTKWILEPYTIDYIKLQVAMMKRDPAETDKCFDRFDEVRLNDQQKITVFENAFYYYVAAGNIEKVRKYGNLLLKVKTFSRAEEIKQYYSIMVEKSYDDLDKMLEELKDADPVSQARMEFLISQMYKNKGDIDNAKKYINLSIQHNDELLMTRTPTSRF